MMTDTPEFEATRELMRGFGLVETDARSTPQAFGSWFISAAAKGKTIRVVWDGREGWLIIQTPSLGGLPEQWSDRWIAGSGCSKQAGDLVEGLLSVLNN